MKGRYHIKKDGTPGQCLATVGNCPLGEHFDTFEEAQRHADELFEQQNNGTPDISSENSLDDLQEKDNFPVSLDDDDYDDFPEFAIPVDDDYDDFPEFAIPVDDDYDDFPEFAIPVDDDEIITADIAPKTPSEELKEILSQIKKTSPHIDDYLFKRNEENGFNLFSLLGGVKNYEEQLIETQGSIEYQKDLADFEREEAIHEKIGYYLTEGRPLEKQNVDSFINKKARLLSNTSFEKTWIARGGNDVFFLNKHRAIALQEIFIRERDGCTEITLKDFNGNEFPQEDGQIFDFTVRRTV